MGLSELRAWLRSAPPGTTLTPAGVLEILEDGGAPVEVVEPSPAPEAELTWRERLWLVPEETRLGTHEALEALGKSRSWLYDQMAEDRARERLPHRKLGSEVVFIAGELRAWLRAREDVVHRGPSERGPLEVIQGGRR